MNNSNSDSIIDSLNQNNMSEFLFSCENEDYFKIDLFLNSSANSSLILKGLEYSCNNKQWGLVEYLLNYKLEAFAFKIPKAIIQSILKDDQFKIIKLIFEKLPSFCRLDDDDLHSFLFTVVYHGCLNTLKYLLNFPNFASVFIQYSDNFFNLAAYENHVNLVLYLAKLPSNYNIDPALNDNRPLNLACTRGNLAMVETLLTIDTVVRASKNDLAIQAACNYGHYNVLKYLLSKPYLKSRLTESDNKLLKLASIRGYLAIMELLLEHKPVRDKAIYISGGLGEFVKYNGMNKFLDLNGFPKVLHQYHDIITVNYVDRNTLKPKFSKDELLSPESFENTQKNVLIFTNWLEKIEKKYTANPEPLEVPSNPGNTISQASSSSRLSIRDRLFGR